jgi:hypothetical protein
MPDEQRRLAWTGGYLSSVTGNAGTARLFKINYDAPSRGYAMRSDLPGLTSKVWKNESREELKDQAEKILDGWLTHVGAFTGPAVV